MRTRYWFRDNEGRRAHISFHWATDDYSVALNWSLEGATVLAALSNARLEKLELFAWEDTSGVGEPAPEGSDVRVQGLLIYRSEADVRGSLIIPAMAFFGETQGVWAPYRVTRESAALFGVLPLLEQLVTYLVLPTDNTPFPSAFEVGALLWLTTAV